MTGELALPGKPGPALARVWAALNSEQRAALLPHLTGGTGGGWIANLLTATGFPIGKTAINDYRRALRQAGV